MIRLNKDTKEFIAYILLACYFVYALKLDTVGLSTSIIKEKILFTTIVILHIVGVVLMAKAVLKNIKKTKEE